jgi:uncharacterized protein with LGFP repeats
MPEKSHRTEIIVAILGLVGALGTAIIANMDKLFAPRHPTENPQPTTPTPSSPQMTPKGAPSTVRDQMLAKARELKLGSPHSKTPEVGQTSSPHNEGYFQRFDRGYVYWSPQTGAHGVWGYIFGKWASLGSEPGILGFPLTDELDTPDGRGRFNHFQGGSIYWTPETGAHEVHGLIRDKWESLGSEQGLLGFPLTDELSTPGGRGRFNHFQRGSIYWTPETGAHEVHGLIQGQMGKAWAGNVALSGIP